MSTTQPANEASDDDVRVETVPDEDDDDEAPALEPTDDLPYSTAQPAAPTHPSVTHPPRQPQPQTKKQAKGVAKMGLKAEPGVLQVVVRKSKGAGISVHKPEVYRLPGTDTFVIFGETRAEEPMNTAQRLAAKAVTGEGVPAAAAAAHAGAERPKAAESTAAALPSPGGVNPPKSAPMAPSGGATDTLPEPETEEPCSWPESTITKLMEQTQATRAQAISTLNMKDGDLVNSIMELSKF